MTSRPTLRLSGPADVAAAVPYLLGFHPSDSIVVLGLSSRIPGAGLVAFSARWDLVPEAAGLATQISGVVRQQRRIEAVMLVAYGPPDIAGPVLDACRAAVRLPVAVALRVDGGRCYCVLCDECMPAEGLPVAADRSRVAAEATFLGLGVLPDRDALVRSVGPVGGPQAMADAVARADARLMEFIDSSATEADPFAGKALRQAGLLAVDEALAAARDDRRLADDEVAWLTLMLESVAVRDHAWESTDHHPWQLRFWLDMTRRAHPELVAPCATLLAFAAWRSGDGALAGVALDRALRADPYYSLALLLRDALQRGVGPDVLGTWPLANGVPRRDRRRRKSRRVELRSMVPRTGRDAPGHKPSQP